MRYLRVLISSVFVIVAESLPNNQCAFESHDTSCTFLDSLKLEEWDVEDKSCLDATIEMLNGVKNSTLWATWMWDSMQYPSGVLYGSRYQLGSFDQCMKTPWLNSHPYLRTQYCLADVHLADVTPKKFERTVDPNYSTDLYINTASKYGRHFNKVTYGVCFSSRCSSQTIKKLVNALFRTQHLPRNAIKETNVHSCQIAGDTKEYGFGFKVFLFIMFLLILVSLLSTYCTSDMTSDTLLTRLTRSFCLKKNWNSLVKNNKDNIRVLDGMRFNSAIIVVMVHYLSYAITLSINNLDVEIEVEEKLLLLFIHLDIVVDTFLVMSGLLLVRSIVRHQQSRKESLTRMLFLRYVRLIGPQAIMVLYFACISMHVSNGPLWSFLSKSEAEDCANNWWANLLMINNYVNTSNMCNMVSWYNACDYQLAILGTVFYCIYQKSRSVGLKFFTMAFLLSILIPGLITYWNQLPAVIVFDIEATRNFKENKVFLSTYIQTHNRAAVYLLGMALGHLMSVYNRADYNKSIPKKLSVIGALIALFIMKSVLYYGADTLYKEYDQLAVATFVALNRLIWALAICCIIVFCEYGTVPIISDYLNMKFAIPMGRLSYGVYMLHMAIIYRILYSIRSPLSYSLTQMIIGGFGVVTLSYLLSFVMWHFIEAPLINVTNVLLDAMVQKKHTEKELHNELNNCTDEIKPTVKHSLVNGSEKNKENGVQQTTKCGYCKHKTNIFDNGYKPLKLNDKIKEY